MLSIAQDLQNDIEPYQSAINTALSVATSLPLVGHQLTALQDLNTLLNNSLQEIEDATQSVANGHIQLAIPLGSISHTFTFDLGLDAFLQLSTSGGVTASIDPTLNIAFNNQDGNVTLDTANTNLDIGFGLSLPGFSAKGSFNGLLFAQAVDQGTNFAGHLTFRFDSDGTVTTHVSGDAQIRLGLSLSFVDPSLNASFNPTFVTQLQLDWGFDDQSQLAAPSITLKGFGLDADSFMHSFIGDIVTTVQKYTEPLEPFIEKFDTPVPILSAFDSSETFGDLLLKGSGLSQDQQDRFNLMVRIIKAVNTIDLSGSTKGAVISFGDIKLTGDATQLHGFNFDTSQLSGAIQQIFDNPVLQKLSDTLKTVANYAGITSTAGFQFPLLENPGPIIGGLLTGQTETMFSFNTGREHFELAPSIGVGIKDLLGIFLSAGVVFDAQLSMGYDTAGLIKLVQDPQHNPADILHGFYFDNGVDTTDPPIPNVTSPRNTAFYLQGFAELSASAVVTLSGGLYANVSGELASTDGSSHVYLDTMIQDLKSPSKVFKFSGQLYAAANIALTFDTEVGPKITLFSYELARDELLDYDPPPAPSLSVPLVVIDSTTQHTLLLDPNKMTGGQVTVQPFHDFPVTSGGNYLADGIRVDYPGEIDLYVERKDDVNTDYYNLIGVNGVVPDGASVDITDPFRVFKDEGAIDPAPPQTKPGVILVGGKNIVYNYADVDDGSHANVLLAGGYGSNTLSGGTIEGGNFIPADRLDQAKSSFGDLSGFDAAGAGLINSAIDAAASPADPSGIIGATMTASHGGLMLGGPGNNSFIATGAGAYEMIGGVWVNTFNISPSFSGVPATYQIDGGPSGQSQLIVRAPADDVVTFENATVPDKYNPSFQALAVEGLAGLSAVAHGIQSVHIVGAPGAHVVLGDTSELNINFSISGGAHLTFGGTNAPDSFSVSTAGYYYDRANHFPVPIYEPTSQGIVVPAPYGIIIPSPAPDPVYSITRTFGTNGRTQTIPFTIDNESNSSITLDGGGASDTYDIALGVGAFIDVSVDDSDPTTQNSLTVEARDSNLAFNTLTVTDNAVHLDYYTHTVFLDAIPFLGPNNSYYTDFSSSVHYTPSVPFSSNVNVVIASALSFLHTIIDRPTSTQSITIQNDGRFYTSGLPITSLGPTGDVYDLSAKTPTFQQYFASSPRSIDVQANAGPLKINYQTSEFPVSADIEGNSGVLELHLKRDFTGDVDTINVKGNSGTLTIDTDLTGSAIATSASHVINVLGNTGTLNIDSEKSDTHYAFGVHETELNIGAGSLANVHGSINIGSLGETPSSNSVVVDDRSGSGALADWTFDPTHIQIRDLLISADIHSEGPTLFDSYWRLGSHVTLIPGTPYFGMLFNDSDFPINWEYPVDPVNYELDDVNMSLANFGAQPDNPVSYAASGLPTGLSLNPTTGLISGTIPLGASLNSPFHSHFSVTDGTYTVETSSTWAVFNDISINFEFVAPADVDEGSNVSLSLYAIDSANRPVTISVSGLPAWLTFDPNTNTISGIAPVGSAADAPYHINVHGDDGVTTNDAPFDLLVSATKFDFVAGTARLNQIGDTVSFSVPATTTSGRPLTYSANLPSGVTIDPDTGLISGTLTGQPGSTLVFVTASDGVTSRSTDFIWNVLPTGASDVVTVPNPGPQLNRVGDATDLQVLASSSTLSQLHYTLQGLPAGFSIGQFGDIAGVVTADMAANSPYVVTVTATDGKYSSSTTFNWTFVDQNPIDVVNPGPITSAINYSIHVQIQATTTAGLPLTYSASGLPTGLSIDPHTGLISGITSPLSSLPGVFNTDVTVTDGTNTYGTMFQWIVNGDNLPSIAPLPIPGGGTLTLTSPSGTKISASITTDPGVARPGGIQFPFGYVNFDITPVDPSGFAPGGSVTLTMSGVNFAQTDQYYKYGPTSANPTPHWYDFLFNQSTDGDSATGAGMEIVGRNLVLHLVDGGRGDDDLTQNGDIHDLGGPAMVVSGATATGTSLTSDHVTGSTYGQLVHLTATVSAASGTPTGTVQFRIDGQNVGSPQTLVNGAASLDVPALSAGDRAIAALYSSDSDSFTDSAGDFTQHVDPALLTITAENETKAYGAALPALTLDYAGFISGESPANLSTPPAVGTTAIAASHVGNYSITASGAVDPNYSIVYVPGTLSVTPAVLTVTADNQSKPYGAALPALTASYSGFVNGDGPSAISGAPNLNTTATASSAVGSYPITVTVGALTALDYSFAFQNGTLTVTPATPIVTWNDPANIPYGQPLGPLQLDATANVHGTFSYTLADGTTPANQAVLNAGQHQTLNAVFTPTDSVDYTTAAAQVEINVESGTLTATALAIHATEVETFSGSVASFTDTDASAAANDFTATIDWGDGASSAGTVSETASSAFVISGSHVYAHETPALSTKVVIGRNGGETTTVSARGSVADAPIELSPGTISTPLGRVVDGLVVATFKHAGDETTSFFTATIDWGDGSRSAASIAESNGVFQIVGSHSYSNAGQYALGVAVSDAAGSTNALTEQAAVQFNPHELYVSAVYGDVLGRAPDQAGLDYWTQKLDAGAAIASVAEGIVHSAEYYANFVIKPDYLRLLGRAADASGLAYWVTQMQHGATDEQLEAESLASDEFFKNAGKSSLGWIDAVYKQLLGRDADVTGATFWNMQLLSLQNMESATDARMQVSLAISNSHENNANLINADYFHYLGRDADPGGLQYWLQKFADGETNEEVIAGFTGATEYYRNKTGVSP